MTLKTLNVSSNTLCFIIPQVLLYFSDFDNVCTLLYKYFLGTLFICSLIFLFAMQFSRAYLNSCDFLYAVWCGLLVQNLAPIQRSSVKSKLLLATQEEWVRSVKQLYYFCPGVPVYSALFFGSDMFAKYSIT